MVHLLVLLPLWSGTALAGWREELGTFRIGMLEGSISTRSVAPLKDAYARALGMPVSIFLARSYAALIDAQATSRIEYAVYSATAYATAWHVCECVEPLAAPVGADGSIGIQSVLILRRGETPFPAVLGKGRLAIGPAADLSTSVLPRVGLQALDLYPADRNLVPTVGLAEATRLFAERKVDGLFGWVTSAPGRKTDASADAARLLDVLGVTVTDAYVAWRSDLLRYGPHAVRSDLDREAKRLLRAFLLGLNETKPDIYDALESHHLGGFRPAAHTDYQLAVELVEALAGAVGQEGAVD